jgi:predicted dehydrogenase
MKKPIKTVLIVGLGSIGRKHIDTIKKYFPEKNIILLRHKDCEKSDIIKLGIFKCLTSIENAIAENPQAAIVANPSPMHIEIAQKLANHGINLLIEKPISNSLKGVSELIKTCNDKKCILMTAYNLRFSPSLIYFREQLQEKIIGNVYSIRSEVGQYLPSWRPESDYSKGVSANAALGGGVLLELSHEIDYLRWIFGPFSWVISSISKQSDLDIDVEDSVNVIIRFNRSDESKVGVLASLNMDFLRHNSLRRCEVIGEKGTLVWDGVLEKVELFEKDCLEWNTIFSSKTNMSYTYKEEVKSFFDSIENGEDPYISGYDGLEVLSIIEAIKKSNTINSKVYLQ